MSEDIPKRDNSGGFIILQWPKRIRFAAAGAVVVSVFSLGAWLAVMQSSVAAAKSKAEEAKEEVDRARHSLRRIERYMCLDCTTTAKFDCSDICGMRRLEAK